MSSHYESFVESKRHRGANAGFEPSNLPDSLFDFQKHIAEWAIRKGRGALFADCGLGKTPMQLAWADNVARHTDKPVLVLTPLAVAPQTVQEGEKFGIDCERSTGAIRSRVVVTNYHKLGHFHPSDFGGVVLDESSILKSFDGTTRRDLDVFMRKVPYRLLATATAAPNDYIELGTSSEALGYMGFMDMLGRFFKNDNNNSGLRRMYGEAPTWRFKGHAEVPFWRWVSSWAKACRKPSDLGYADGRFILPELSEVYFDVEPNEPPPGCLFTTAAATLPEQREEKKRTIKERCEAVAQIADHADPVVVWCNLNDEGDLLEQLIPGSVQVAGKHSDQVKEDRLQSFSNGSVRVLITKPQIGAWGLNWQHCNRVVYFPTHSFESYYQAVRRCWRFGQTRPVRVDIVATEGERLIMANLKRKADQAERMFANLVAEMNRAEGIDTTTRFDKEEEIPSWLF